RQAAVPYPQNAFPDVDVQEGGATEHFRRQDELQLGVDLAKDVMAGVTLGRHPVEGLGQRHGTDGGRQAMSGEVAQQDEQLAGRRLGRQQYIAVEQRLRRLSVTDVAGIQATGVGHLVEDRLGGALLAEQLPIMIGDEVALRSEERRVGKRCRWRWARRRLNREWLATV